LAPTHPNDGRVVSNFIVNALLGRDITVFGDGLQTRSFCYVDDLIDGLIRFMNTPDDITGPKNIGNPKEFTMLELARPWYSIPACNRVLSIDQHSAAAASRHSMANNVLAWAPQTALPDGLLRTITYFEQLLSDEALRPHILEDIRVRT